MVVFPLPSTGPPIILSSGSRRWRKKISSKKIRCKGKSVLIVTRSFDVKKEVQIDWNVWGGERSSRTGGPQPSTLYPPHFGFDRKPRANVCSDQLLKRTVWASECRSWFKNGRINGRITALYPGSILHFVSTCTPLCRWFSVPWCPAEGLKTIDLP